MKVALVCIAKNEENYIREWVNYHIKLGFDTIIVYENDWRCEYSHPQLIKIPLDGVRKQVECYNLFLQQNKTNYDWVAFFDVDEFLVLKKHNNVKDFISEYSTHPSISINWVLFGDNGLTHVDDNNYSVINRFTKRQLVGDIHTKSIVKTVGNFHMLVHNTNGTVVDTNNKTRFNTPYNYDKPIDVAQLNHYFCKTKEEFVKKVERGRADTGTYRDMSEFDKHNINEIDDFYAYNFINNKT
jgi:hypothetical protein